MWFVHSQTLIERIEPATWHPDLHVYIFILQRPQHHTCMLPSDLTLRFQNRVVHKISTKKANISCKWIKRLWAAIGSQNNPRHKKQKMHSNYRLPKPSGSLVALYWNRQIRTIPCKLLQVVYSPEIQTIRFIYQLYNDGTYWCLSHIYRGKLPFLPKVVKWLGDAEGDSQIMQVLGLPFM